MIDNAPRDPTTVLELATNAAKAMDDDEYPAARVLLDALRSEIRDRTYHIPLGTYPDALKKAAQLLDQKKNDEASAELLTAVNTLVAIDKVTPIPLLLARSALNGAQVTSQKDKAAAQKLLEAAKAEVLRAKQLGYAGILLVNDEESVCCTLREILIRADYQCRAVLGGPEALALLRSGERFDLLVHDLLNPHLDGFSLLQQAKQQFPELPVIVVSAVDDDSAADACLDSGAFEYLRLPIEIQQFLDTISLALADARLKESMRTAVSQMSKEELFTAFLDD